MFHSKVTVKRFLRQDTSPCLTVVARMAFIHNDIHFRNVTKLLPFVVSRASSRASGGGFLQILRALSTFCANSDPFVTTRCRRPSTASNSTIRTVCSARTAVRRRQVLRGLPQAPLQHALQQQRQGHYLHVPPRCCVSHRSVEMLWF